MGGILTNDEEAEIALVTEVLKLAEELGAKNIELRNTKSIQWFNNFNSKKIINTNYSINCGIRSHKVRMMLKLPDTAETLMKSFKSKLRSQIRKPIKKGLKSKIGGADLLDDFYKVFSTNMRDLGSPVHSKSLLRNVIEEFSEDAKVVVVYRKKMPVACSMIIGFKDTLENPWASSLREFSKLSPNMLLYWAMLEYACENGFKYFDFGRCSPGSGTYRFKEQWGAHPEPLHWHYISLDGKPIDTAMSEKSSFDFAAQVWRKLPVSVTRLIGPSIRKYIGL
jgi:FemAB-related protein (PEP-CTERM system-associated)